MLEEVVVIVWVDKQLDSIWTVDVNAGNVLCGIRKKLWTRVFCTSKTIVILRLLQMVYKQLFQRC